MYQVLANGWLCLNRLPGIAQLMADLGLGLRWGTFLARSLQCEAARVLVCQHTVCVRPLVWVWGPREWAGHTFVCLIFPLPTRAQLLEGYQSDLEQLRINFEQCVRLAAQPCVVVTPPFPFALTPTVDPLGLVIALAVTLMLAVGVNTGG